MVAISPIRLPGNWKDGYALDIHSISSTHIGDNEFGHPQFDTKRSELGELLYRLKSGNDQSVVGPIIETTMNFLAKQKWSIDIVVPVPPSRPRSVQPVMVLSKTIADSLKVDVCPNCITKIKDTPELKNVYDFAKRTELLNGAYDALPKKLEGRTVLLFDDLYRSGATLKSVANVILEKGKAKTIYALTLTKTRSKR